MFAAIRLLNSVPLFFLKLCRGDKQHIPWKNITVAVKMIRKARAAKQRLSGAQSSVDSQPATVLPVESSQTEVDTKSAEQQKAALQVQIPVRTPGSTTKSTGSTPSLILDASFAPSVADPVRPSTAGENQKGLSWDVIQKPVCYLLRLQHCCII